MKEIAPKFVGRRAFLERCIVALATNRGLMLIGEPGTAKSYLSELLAAAISRDSTLTIQGNAGTTEDNIKYSWNYAFLLAQGPSEASLVPAPFAPGDDARQNRPVRGDHTLSAGNSGCLAVDLQRPRHDYPRTRGARRSSMLDRGSTSSPPPISATAASTKCRP